MVLTKYLHKEMKGQFPRENIGQGYSPDVAFRWFLGDTSSPLHGAQKVRKVPSLKKYTPNMLKFVLFFPVLVIFFLFLKATEK